MNRKTKEQLLKELESLKERLSKLEKADFEQKKIIEALSESEAKYRLLFDAAPVGIGIADLEGNIIDANRNMQEMSGFSLEDYRAVGVGATYANPEEREIMIKTLREKGKVRDWEERLKHKDGSEYHTLLNADIMELGGRKVVLGIIRDISERKRIEVELNAALTNAEDEKNKSEAIIAALGDGIIIQDTDYKIIYQNQVQNDIYGDRTGELCFKTYDGRDKICENCPVEKTFMDGKIHRSEKKVPTNKGYSYFELTSSPLRNSTGKIIAGIKIVRDITASKRAEEELHESEEKYRTLIENIQGGVFIIQDAKLQYINEAFARIAGYEVEEVIGKEFMEFIAPEDLKLVKDYYSQRLAGENVPREYEFSILCKDGRKIIVNMNISLINYCGRVASIGIILDVTERKRVQEALREGERFMESIFASIQDSIGIIDSEMNIIRVNKTTESWYPFAAPLVGRKVMKLIITGKSDVRFALPGKHLKPIYQLIK